jgi:hypothetical protein
MTEEIPLRRKVEQLQTLSREISIKGRRVVDMRKNQGSKEQETWERKKGLGRVQRTDCSCRRMEKMCEKFFKI